KNTVLELDAMQLKKAALHLRAVNHPLRQQIISLLHKNGQLMVTTIYVKLRIEQSVASQHLAVLRRAKLVSAEREGKKIFYQVNYNNLERLQKLAKEMLGS
ncbi:MAG TPA: metalloregulator ArsR/SmtB family transcription factor, partial [Flavisolibacter sp.]|nr:metalloregulator ArsR/SmtB family transcription factor [Flavisolibacter sp.]